MEEAPKMTEEEEFEFRLRLEKERGAPTGKEKSQKPVGWGELDPNIAGSFGGKLLGLKQYFSGDPAQIAAAPPTRFAVGAASPIIGIADRLAGNSGVIQDFNALAKEGGATGFDAAGTAGNVLSPAGLALAKALPAAKTATGAIGQAGLMGGLGGFTAPAENYEEAARNALVGTAGGAAIGGAVQGAGGAANWLSRTTSEIRDLFRSGDTGAKNILRRYVGSPKVVGEEAMPAVISAAKNADPILPGGAPMMADATVGGPGASPISALQHIVSKSGGGQSDAFINRLNVQEQAVEAAKAARKAASEINYAKAFDPKIHKMVPDAELTELAKNPYFQEASRSPAIEKLAKARELTPDENLGELLHAVKVSLDKKLKGGPKEEALDAMTYREIAKVKDQLVKWLSSRNKDYDIGRQEFAKASKDIERFIERQAEAAKPKIKTSLGGGINITEETRQHMPNLLSRPAMLANYLMKAKSAKIEPKVDLIARELLLDPAKFADEMSRLPPEFQIDIMRAVRPTNALSFGTANSLGSQ
jgi:hypothetical protein